MFHDIFTITIRENVTIIKHTTMIANANIIVSISQYFIYVATTFNIKTFTTSNASYTRGFAPINVFTPPYITFLKF